MRYIFYIVSKSWTALASSFVGIGVAKAYRALKKLTSGRGVTLLLRYSAQQKMHLAVFRICLQHLSVIESRLGQVLQFVISQAPIRQVLC